MYERNISFKGEVRTAKRVRIFSSRLLVSWTSLVLEGSDVVGREKTFRKIQDCGWLFFSISNHVNKFESGLKTHKLFLCISCLHVHAWSR